MAKIKMTMDGNTAAAYAAYAFTDVASIYPITPSSTMAEVTDEWASIGRKNIFGQVVNVVEMQSEAGAAGTFHGALQGGALTTTFTASQGLLLMLPNMYKVSGELLPGVIHVSARAIATHALSIFGDQQDIMAAKQTGFAILAASSVQEVVDLAPVAHLSAIKGRLPFLHFFDGFRTSHEIQKIEALEYSDYAEMLDWEAVKEFRSRALSPLQPVTRGSAQNADVYFQNREAANPFYTNIITVVEDYFAKMEARTGRKYNLFDYYGDPNAEHIIVAMGSVCETVEQVVDYYNTKGEKYGLIKVRLFRPFSVKHLLDVIPSSVKSIGVLDRSKEPGAAGEVLYQDIITAYKNNPKAPIIVGGRYGLASKDTTPNQIAAVFINLKESCPKDGFTIGIVDDVTNTSLKSVDDLNVEAKDMVSCQVWGLGSDGTVGANKQAIKIIGDNTDKYVQAYFDYDSKKSGGSTISHLRFSSEPIRSTYLVNYANYVACHNQSYVHKYDLLHSIKPGGTFVLNTQWSDDELEDHLPARIKQAIAKKNVEFYTINAIDIAAGIGLGNRINMVMQGAFFKLTNVLPEEVYLRELKNGIKKMYGKKGDKIVSMNQEAVDQGIKAIHKVTVPKEWANAKDKESNLEEPDFIRNIMRPMSELKGNDLPVSAFKGIEDGTLPHGTTAYEKRGIAVNVPHWIEENCIQCNQCSFVCPHAVIRPFLLDAEEKANAPETFNTIKPMGKAYEGLEYIIQISPMDCTGCGNCADVCPGKKGEKALRMQPIANELEAQVPNWNYAIGKVKYKHLDYGSSFKDSQFKQPLLEFSGACAGCGETPYAKLLTQLFGQRMMIANATGCSSIWSASSPSTAYTISSCTGRGPSWANSLFEDNAEFGYGMYLAVKHLRNKLEETMNQLITKNIDDKVKEVLADWIHYKEDSDMTEEVSRKVLTALEGYKSDDVESASLIKDILDHKDYLEKRCLWIIGGDGWAYDIGYGGLDHVLASGEDINVLIYDTEVYSNTGGQASKSTPTAAIAKFASSGKRQGKKDLGRMMMTYGNVYVAQVGINADNTQLLKAYREAEAHKGPSIIICLSPCINHGIKEGMGRSMATIKKAVQAGYWHLYRYNPALREEGKNPFVLDSKEPTADFREFILGQVRYSSLEKAFPEQADELFTRAEKMAKEKYLTYKQLSETPPIPFE